MADRFDSYAVSGAFGGLENIVFLLYFTIEGILHMNQKQVIMVGINLHINLSAGGFCFHTCLDGIFQQIGREVIGTTVNTLLFAYVGESLLLFSYLKMQDYTLETLLNSKILFQNCVSMIFGAIACVVVMPVAAVLVGRHLPGYNH